MSVQNFSGNNSIEEWRTIAEFPTYEVSSFGNIRNKKTPDKLHSLNKSGRGRVPVHTYHGYVWKYKKAV